MEIFKVDIFAFILICIIIVCAGALLARAVRCKSSRPRTVSASELLFRDARSVGGGAETEAFYRGKTVLVTGGGGSIGSEICRRVAEFRPKAIIIVDIYENNAYELKRQLGNVCGDEVEIRVCIASVRDRDSIDMIFDRYRPSIVFHAAAHKHVPLMEDAPREAVKNNVLGTLNVADAAERYRVERFILISTDKAVNPTGIMGASKRVCEMIVQSRSSDDTIFSSVRFGNVLGSAGSVVPLFREQIEAGGPVTVTDRRITRYFMTVGEAAELVLEAGRIAQGGDVLVLDMGEPVRVIELAERLIKLSGLRPYRDIAIEEIGLRPGEKLYEEPLVDKSRHERTENGLIFRERGEAISREKMDGIISELELALEARDNAAIFVAMENVVPTFSHKENKA